MNNFNIRHIYKAVAVVIAVGFMAAGCGGGGGGPASSVNPANDVSLSRKITSKPPKYKPNNLLSYSMTFLGSFYDSGADTTEFSYQVVSNPDTGPSISNWYLFFPDTCAFPTIVSSSDSSTEFKIDNFTGKVGLKFGTGYSTGESRTVTVVFDGKWFEADATFVIKAGSQYVMNEVTGPSCEELYSISGFVYIDDTYDFIWHSAESLYPYAYEAQINILDGSTVIATAVPSYWNSFYSTLVPPGIYELTVTSLAVTTPDAIMITVTDSSVSQDLGVCASFPADSDYGCYGGY